MHTDCRGCEQDEEWEQEDGTLPGYTAKRQPLDESAKTLEQPINKRGCNGPPIIFSDEVERMKERSDPHRCRPKRDTARSQRLDMQAAALNLRH